MAKNILTQAIAFEEKGYELYRSLEKKAKDKITKQLFKSLAKQEKDHISYIKQYAKTAVFKKVKVTTIEKEVKAIYSKIKKELLPERKLDNRRGYESALKLENNGYSLYKTAAEKAETPQDKKFYEFLRNMEKDHYESLANVYFYYTDNASWLEENESKTWNWMNF